MHTVSFITAMLSCVVCMVLVPAKATAQPMPELAAAKTHLGVVEGVGWRRRYYRRNGYPVPYAYYPPGYGYYLPPAAYVYPPAIGYDLPEGYGVAPPPEGAYVDENDYGDALPPEGDYADAPPPEGY
jgi:hypothetical protein